MCFKFFFLLKRELLSKRLVEHARIGGGGSTFLIYTVMLLSKIVLIPWNPPPLEKISGSVHVEVSHQSIND